MSQDFSDISIAEVPVGASPGRCAAARDCVGKPPLGCEPYCVTWLLASCLSCPQGRDAAVVESYTEHVFTEHVAVESGGLRGSPRCSRNMVLQPNSRRLLTADETTNDEPDTAAKGSGTAEVSPSELRLHLAVWDDNISQVQELLQAQPELVSCKDRYNVTALGLAIQLRRKAITQYLIDAGADLLLRDAHGWRLEVHVPRAFPEADDLLAQAATAVGRQSWGRWQKKAVALAERLQGLPDCDLAISWAFSTWVPAMGRLLPQDNVRVRKMGARLRVDYTCKFSGLSWEHRNCSVLACPDKNGAVHFLDHEQQRIDSLERRLLRTHQTEQERARRQRGRPTKRGFLNTANATIEDTGQRTSCGSFANCKLYQLAGLEYTTLILPRLAGTQAQDSMSKWRPLLNLARGAPSARSSQQEEVGDEVLQFDSYFVGCATAEHAPTAAALPSATVHRVRKLTANVLMSKDFPLTCEQFLAIADVLSTSDERYIAIKEFFQTSLPDGFPVQFTIPVFPAISATLSFTTASLCAQEADVFEAPKGYELANKSHSATPPESPSMSRSRTPSFFNRRSSSESSARSCTSDAESGAPGKHRVSRNSSRTPCGTPCA